MKKSKINEKEGSSQLCQYIPYQALHDFQRLVRGNWFEYIGLVFLFYLLRHQSQITSQRTDEEEPYEGWIEKTNKMEGCTLKNKRKSEKAREDV